MTGFDGLMEGLIEARSKQISDLVRRTNTARQVRGTGRSKRESTLFEAAISKVMVPEEIISKAIGQLTTDDPKYSFENIGNYHTQTSFADNFRDTGMDHVSAAILGIAAAVLNPLDPINKLKILQPTKLGKAAEAVATVGDDLVEGAGGIWAVSSEKIREKISGLERSIKTKQFDESVLPLAERSLIQNRRALSQVDEMNAMLKEVQERGVKLSELRLGGSIYDQVLQGQRHLVGFGSLRELGISGRTPSIYGFGGKAGAAVIKSATSIKDKALRPLSDAAYKMADYIGIPTTRGDRARTTSANVKAILNNNKASEADKIRDLLGEYTRFLEPLKETGQDAGRNDLLFLLQNLELKNSGVKEMAIDVLTKMPQLKAFPEAGKGVEVARGQGLTNDQKLKLAPSGVPDAEIPVAIAQFERANTQSLPRLGKHGQHEVKLLGRHIVVKTSDPVAAAKDVLDDLDGIYGNRVWTKQSTPNGTYFVQSRFPGATRISKTSDFQPVHLRQLESIAAQLSSKKKGFTAIKPDDILVSETGAVQIINPTVVADYKSARQALENSREAIDNLAGEHLKMPKGPVRQYPSLATVTAARSVPRGLTGLEFRTISDVNIPEGAVRDMNTHDLLDQAINTQGFREYVRAAYDQIEPQELAKIIGNRAEFEVANDIDFYRKQIREAVAKGEVPTLDPISITVDKNHNLAIVNGRARLTAAILEGFETIQVYNRGFVGEIAEAGFHRGKTVKLSDLWRNQENSSTSNLIASRKGIVASNYSLIGNNGEVLKVDPGTWDVDPRWPSLFNRFVSLGPQHAVGPARVARIKGVNDILLATFGNHRNAFIRLSEMAETSETVRDFAAKVEGLLGKSQNGAPRVSLDNVFRHPNAENLFIQLRNISTRSLDNLATRGVLTPTTVKDIRRVMLASDEGDLVVHVLEAENNTIRAYSNGGTTKHLRTTVESWINKSVNLADVTPYARVELNGIDGQVRFEVKDMVTSPHPQISEVLEPISSFSVSPDNLKALQSEGIFVVNNKNVDNIRQQFNAHYFPQDVKGKSIGVLLNEKEVNRRSTKTGQILPGEKTTVLVRPEFTFFATRSGELVIGTKHKNVNDLLNAVYEEGPRYFEEFGVMTTGKIIVSNPFGGRMEKIGIGEMRLLEERLQTLAQRFNDLGFDKTTVLQVHVPFDDAVWRSMYGEKRTIGDILDDSFELKIPEGLKNHVPDIRVLAPGRTGIDAQEMGVVGIERTRLANKRLQDLFQTLEDTNDRLFLERAKAGIPVAYHTSWLEHHLTPKMKAAMQEAWMKFPDKTSKTYQFLEANLKGRVFTDLTTQEVNAATKRLQKEGEANVEQIIADVVASFRQGYKLNPTKETADALIAISKIMPEGVDFFQLDPIWSTALSVQSTQRAISRKQIVESIKELDVAIWHGTLNELDKIKIGKNPKYLAADKEVREISDKLTRTEATLQELMATTPDLANSTRKLELERAIDDLKHRLVKANEARAAFTNVGKGKVLDTMVDLESEQVWIRGEDLTRLIDGGLVKASDVLGDPADAFVRVPIKKYASLLDRDNQEVFLFPKEIAGVVQKFFQATTKDGFGKFLSIWDSLHAVWRNWTLFPIPAYHVRNGLSNMFMAYLGDVTDPIVYKQAFSIMNIIEGHRTGKFTKAQVQEALGAINFPTAHGTVVTGQQMFDEFSRHGGMAGGLNFNEFKVFGTQQQTSEFARMSVKAGLTPSSELAGSWLFDNAALRLGVSASSFVENRFRLAAFIDAMVKGRVETKGGVVLTGFEAASMHMKKVFYDYSDLSAFERSWLRRVIPFYSWSRHNIPRMLTTIVTDPVKHFRMAEFFQNIEEGVTEGSPYDERDLPQWVRDKYGLIIGKTKEGKYVVKTGDGLLPMVDAYKMLSGSGIIKMIGDGITPFVKVPVEQLTNYSFYADRPIEKVPGQRAASFTLGQVGMSRRATTEGPLGVLNLVLNESMFRTFFRPGGELATKVFDPIFDGKEGPSLTMGVFALALGKAYEIDPAQARMAIFKDWKKRHQQLINVHNQALREGDMKSVEDTTRMLTWLRLQYPGEREM